MNKFVFLPAFLVGAILSTACHASPYRVYSGCTLPKDVPNNTWHINPITGSDTGDGTASNPWKTLQTVVDAAKIASPGYVLPYAPGKTPIAATKGVVKPGDTILLYSGNHGTVSLKNMFNDDFIVVKAAAGNTPVLDGISITGGSRWAFDGLTIKHTKPASTSVYNLFSVRANSGYWGPANNIIIHNSTLKSQDSITEWTPEDWRNSAAAGISVITSMVAPDGTKDYQGVNNGECVSMTYNKISNVTFGIVTSMSNKVLIYNNTIDNISDDGIDFGSSNVSIDLNKITNIIDDGDGMHRDFMQGQPLYGQETYNHDVSITRNYLQAQTSSNVKYPASVQGINIFDGRWKNVTISGNIVLGNTYHGIALMGIDSPTIINNTVLSVGDAAKSFLQEGALAGSAPQSTELNTDAVKAGGQFWIRLTKSKDGVETVNGLVRNNIASAYAITSTDVIIDHNIISGTATKYWMPVPTGKEIPSIFSPDNLFVAFSPAAYQFDIHLKEGSPAIGFGSKESAPGWDRFGVQRKVPVDAGAAAFPK